MFKQVREQIGPDNVPPTAEISCGGHICIRGTERPHKGKKAAALPEQGDVLLFSCIRAREQGTRSFRRFEEEFPA